jgi:hypothetical protein
MTPEMAEMMERTIEQYFAAYWQKHATPEQEARRVAEGKTFAGAFAFAKSVAEKYNHKSGNSGCVAMPDDVAYWILMEYMEHEKEGARYRTAEEIEAEAKREAEAAERKRKEAEEKAAKRRAELEAKAATLNANSMLTVTPEDVARAEREAEKAKKEAAAVRERAKAEAEKSKQIAKKFEQAQMTLF